MFTERCDLNIFICLSLNSVLKELRFRNSRDASFLKVHRR